MSKKPPKSDRLPWFKFHQDLWLEGTRELTPPQRGIYVDCLCLMYKYDRPLKDDIDWVAHQLHVKPSIWKRVRGELVACGKLVETPDGLVNERAEQEIVERGIVREKRSKSASFRQEILRSEPQLPFENNGRGGALAPRKGLHARAYQDNQKEERETKEREDDELHEQSKVIDFATARAADQAASFAISDATRRDIERIGADPDKIVDKVRKHIAEGKPPPEKPDDYAFACARNEQGLTQKQAARILHGHPDEKQAAYAEVLKPSPIDAADIQRMSAPKENRSALAKTLKK